MYMNAPHNHKTPHSHRTPSPFRVQDQGLDRAKLFLPHCRMLSEVFSRKRNLLGRRREEKRSKRPRNNYKSLPCLIVLAPFQKEFKRKEIHISTTTCTNCWEERRWGKMYAPKSHFLHSHFPGNRMKGKAPLETVPLFLSRLRGLEKVWIKQLSPPHFLLSFFHHPVPPSLIMKREVIISCASSVAVR